MFFTACRNFDVFDTCFMYIYNAKKLEQNGNEIILLLIVYADAKTERLMITLTEYYIANKEPDCDWVIMPRTNISAYLGSATYMEMYESRIPEGFMEKKPEMGGVSAVRIVV